MGEKLKQKDLPAYRQELLNNELSLCVLCRKRVNRADQALDHDHKTGYCRYTIHKDCNILLGKIENFVNRYGKKMQGERLRAFLGNASWYIAEDYEKMGRLIHPTHKTPNDRKINALRRRLKKAKRESTKERIRQQIKELQ